MSIIGSLTPKQIAGLSTTAIVALTTSDVAELSTSQIAALSATQINAFETTDLQAFEAGLYAFINSRHSDVFRGIVEKKQLDDTLKKGLDAAVKEFTAEFSAGKATAA